jgi:hypothetical protein
MNNDRRVHGARTDVRRPQRRPQLHAERSGQLHGRGKDRWGFSWQITPRVLLDATTSPDPAAAKRAFDAMMPMAKIDIATIEAALEPARQAG